MYIVPCPAGTTDGFDCDLSPLDSTTTDSTGSFTTTTVAQRVIVANVFDVPTELDCAVDACVLGVGDINQERIAFAPIDFADIPLPRPTITVTPSDGLLDGDQVQVVGTGFRPNVVLRLSQCPPGASHRGRVRPHHLITGRRHGGRRKRRVHHHDPGRAGGGEPQRQPTDARRLCACRPARFSLEASSNRWVRFHPLSFSDVPLPQPSLTVTPNGDAFGAAQVTGTGFRPGVTHTVLFCGPVQLQDCLVPFVTFVSTDTAGSFSTSIAVSRIPGPDLPTSDFDCLIDDCTVLVARATIPVAESDPVVWPTPQLTVEINPDGTLLAGTNDAVVHARVSCDFSTPFSVAGTITQPGISGGFDIENETCTGGDSTLVVIPARDFTEQTSDFALGPASVTISAFPHRSLSEGTAQDTTATVELFDFAAVKAAVDLLLADPANTELRALVLEAIADSNTPGSRLPAAVRRSAARRQRALTGRRAASPASRP